MKRLILILTLAAQPAIADYNLNGKVIDCYCTDTEGARVDVGESICLHVDGRSFMAQCQMSLNVPMWREIAPACLSSEMRPGSIGGQSSNPALDTLPVDVKILATKT
ncbi:hypothetical protein [uncultured Shimia sp.]|uniref:hypothetical protein n=1 Tax=uncultured Shimia sp. TaxID=573152 RepID=UPI0026079271|nr:hypothetical protein [uncultured Shimia sp.]